MEYDPIYLLLNKIFLVLIIIVTVLLALWVYLNSPKRRVGQLFALMTLSFLFWWAGGYFFSFSKNLDATLWFGRLILGVASISFALLYFFIVIFPRKVKINKILDYIVISLTVIFFFLSIFTNYIVKDVEFTKWGVDPIYGKGGVLFYIWIFFISVIIFIKLIQKYFSITKAMRMRVQYIFLGFSVFILINLVFNVLFPILTGSIKYWQIGNYSSLFFLGFTAYAIVAKQLFGMKVALTQFLVGLIAILLLWQAVVVIPDWFEFSWRFALLLLFLFFGYLLVRSVKQEIKRRAELQQLYLKVEKLSKAKSDFISIASHQLRTPLSVIKGYLSMILEDFYGPVAKPIREKLENVLENNERLVKLVDNLLDLSHLEKGEVEYEFKRVSFKEIVKGAVDMLKGEATKKGLALVFDKAKTKELFVKADAQKLHEVIFNLIDNAIKYTGQGNVTVSLVEENGFAICRVKDTGIGISPEEKQYLFKRFARGMRVSRIWTEGAGLGLYVARMVIEAHKGQIGVESQGEGKGSEFWVRLPVTG